MTQGVQEEIGILAAIETECHFIQIGREMLCADTMPRSDNAALKQRESVFDCIGMNVTVNIDFGFVLDRFMPICECESFHRRGVRIEFIGYDHINVSTNVIAYELRQCARLCILSMEESEIAATLTNANHNLLCALPKSWFALMSALDSADVGFIYFDRTIQQWLVNFFHRRTNAMAEIPCGLIADSQSSLDLVSTHSLAGLAEQERGKEPLLQRQMRIIEDRASGDAELIVALFAVEQLLCSRKLYGSHLTAQALNAVRPAQAHQKLSAFVVGIEQVNYVN